MSRFLVPQRMMIKKMVQIQCLAAQASLQIKQIMTKLSFPKHPRGSNNSLSEHACDVTIDSAVSPRISSRCGQKHYTTGRGDQLQGFTF
jgi:hypothetical protein